MTKRLFLIPLFALLALCWVILLAFMLFAVKGLPALMGGAQDANGNPLTISYSVAADAAE